MLFNRVAHCRCHADCSLGVVQARQGIVEDDHKTIAHEPLESASMLRDLLAET